MNDSSITPAVPGNGPWRVLVLDTSDGDDARWLICSVTIRSDVRAAIMEPGGRRYADWSETVEWVCAQVGRPMSLVPIAAIAWRIDEGQPR